MADDRHPPTPLGASGLKVSKLWLGAMMFGDQTDEAEAARIVAATRDAGLNAIDKFAWIGSFSAGGLSTDYEATYPALDEKANKQLKLLWVACGTEDNLITANRKFLEWLDTKKVQYTKVETSGAHTWMVWRRNLATFAPLLFHEKRDLRSAK